MWNWADGRATAGLSYGYSEVSIPESHTRGRIERPQWWKLQFRENRDKHVVITSCGRLDLAAWQTSVQNQFEKSHSRSVLVFIHGYNVGFDAALRRTAQIGLDIGFNGVLACFSWCSQSTTKDYVTDYDNAELSAPDFAKFLRMLREEVGADEVHVIAHSMGNRVLVSALKEMTQRDSKHLHEIVMAAPDVDQDVFQSVFPKLSKKARRFTIYGSERDRALLVSRKVRANYPRLGDGGNRLYVASGVETVDASTVPISFFDARHSYTFGETSVAADLFYVIRHSLPARMRNGLREKTRNSIPYWEFAV